MGYDLHVHSTYSDGLLTPEELIDEAIKIGLKGLALTDHDTVAGIQPAFNYLEKTGLPFQLIPGIELNTECGPHETHILGYFIDWNYPPLQKRLLEVKEAREERAYRMVKKLGSMGIDISLERVQELAKGDLVGRPHIAQAMAEKGYVFSVKEAFEKYIGRGRPAYIPRYKFLPEEAHELIRNAGGTAVLAHPGLIGNDNLVEKLLNIGLAGIEVYYPEHSLEDTRRYLEMARRFNLIITGGSDFHGTTHDRTAKLGCITVDELTVQALKSGAGR